MHPIRGLALALAVTLATGCGGRPPASVAPRPERACSELGRGGAQRFVARAGGLALRLDVLDDDLLQIELAPEAEATPPGEPLPSSPMVVGLERAGPEELECSPEGLATAELRVELDPARLCLTVRDRRRGDAVLSRICPLERAGSGDPRPSLRGLAFEGGTLAHAYGLGEQLWQWGEANGDLEGRWRGSPDPMGNAMEPLAGGNVGNVQVPIVYFLGEDGGSHALFLDDASAHRWSFRGEPWTVEAGRGGPLRLFLLAGPDLPDLRADFMTLVGRPPVPPRAAFGLWVSEYGFDSWDELRDKLRTLREHRFPVDGFVLDLQWFGDVVRYEESSRMGALAWDEERFPAPAATVRALREEDGVRLMAIEESYVSTSTESHELLGRAGGLVRDCRSGEALFLRAWWGAGGMIDWTNAEAAALWHDRRRQPLVEAGIVGHWTDLGEPETYSAAGCYSGGLRHPEVHNLYNLFWHRSIAQGYERHGVAARPFLLSRSGAAGIQRYGAALWSGDIGSNLGSLAAHQNAQMHVSMSGIDYFGSDIGGFYRHALRGDEDETYTQWLAAGALLDVPVRVHARNLCNCLETAPDRIGDLASNLWNLRRRYELLPYLYSLAHRAHRFGEPVFPPLVFYYQDDATTRELGDLKLLGRDLLVATVHREGQTSRDLYLPAGRWYERETGRSIDSRGEWLRGVPLVVEGVFRLPLYARAGAIVPVMVVDEQTMNALGRRLDGSRHDDLVLEVYPGAEPTSFTVYEDDGETVAYLRGEVRQTVVHQREGEGAVEVRVDPASGTYAGAPTERGVVVRLAGAGSRPAVVSLDGEPLPRLESCAGLEAGYCERAEGLELRAGRVPVGRRLVFEVR